MNISDSTVTAPAGTTQFNIRPDKNPIGDKASIELLFGDSFPKLAIGDYPAGTFLSARFTPFCGATARTYVFPVNDGMEMTDSGGKNGMYGMSGAEDYWHRPIVPPVGYKVRLTYKQLVLNNLASSTDRLEFYNGKTLIRTQKHSSTLPAYVDIDGTANVRFVANGMKAGYVIAVSFVKK